MSPEDRHKIIISGEATVALNTLGIDSTGDNRPVIDILSQYHPELAKKLAQRAEALLSIEG